MKIQVMNVNNILRICLGILFLFAHQAWASDWILYTKSSTGDLYYDQTSLEMVENNIMTVRTKKIYNENGKTKVFAFLKSLNHAPGHADTLKHDLITQAIDCEKEKRSDSLLIIYDENDHVVYADDMIHPWKNIVPDSVTDALKKAVCAARKTAGPDLEPAPAANATSIHQNNFDSIRLVHPDFEKHWNSGAIKAWIQKQPPALRDSFMKTYDEGDADSVIALITRFKQEALTVQEPVAQDQRYKGFKGIELMNGDIIEGQIMSMNPETVTIRAKDGKVSSYSFVKEVRRFIKE